MDEYTVPFEKLEKITSKLKQNEIENVSFEFIISSLFPLAWDKMKEVLLQERIAGYNEAKKEMYKVLDVDYVN